VQPGSSPDKSPNSCIVSILKLSLRSGISLNGLNPRGTGNAPPLRVEFHSITADGSVAGDKVKRRALPHAWINHRRSFVLYATAVSAPRILHVSSRELVQKLRDDILRIQGFEVVSTLSLSEALEIVQKTKYDLVVIDVEGENRVAGAELLCGEIKKAIPEQRVAYVCNHRVSLESDCPDEIIRAEFNPELVVRSVREMIANS